MVKSFSSSLSTRRYFSLEQWLNWQETFHFTAIELGLDRCKSVAETLGLLNPGHKIISVAGTNGKGSSVKMLSSIFTQAGYNTGCYSSPHITRYNERIQLNETAVDDALLCESFSRIDQARGDISLTYFEFGTLAAMDIFSRAGIDIAILEVGLGGRLDAVNCFDSNASLITSIDLDHQNWLGKDRESIAREKAGILRSNIPAVCSDEDPPQSLISYAKQLNAPIFLNGRDFDVEIKGNTWSWHSEALDIYDLPKPSLHNDAQIQNAAGVLMVLSTLSDKYNINELAIKKGFSEFKLEGRFQMFPDNAQVILDVAHNCESANNLVKNLKKLPVSGSTHILIGMLKDKDHHSVFMQLKEIVDFWHIVPLKEPRGTETNTLGKVLSAMHEENHSNVYASVAEALDYIRSIVSLEDRIVITGSFLTVAAAIDYYQKQL